MQPKDPSQRREPARPSEQRRAIAGSGRGVAEGALVTAVGERLHAAEERAPRRVRALPFVLLGCLLLAWAASQWQIARPAEIAGSWREADTQAIARNFHREGLDLLRPRVDWRGDGPGYVESELQLYTAAIAIGMRAVGEVEWLGQALSLLCTLVATAALFDLARRRFGPYPALIGALALLTSRLGVALSVSVMPDAASLMFFVLGLRAFVAFTDRGSRWALVQATVFTALASLIKAPALQLGAIQFLLLVFAAPRRLARPGPWLAWAAVLGVVAAHLWFANGLYRDTGLTFGVLAGGDVKFPDPAHLVMPGLYFDLLGMALFYGLGVLGALALIYLIARARIRPLEIALILGNALGLVVSMRYSSDAFAGPHYHAHIAVTAALLVSHAMERVEREWLARPLPGLFSLLAVGFLTGQYAFHLFVWSDQRLEVQASDSVLLGRELGPRLADDDQIVVRSPKPAMDPFWERRNNFEEPTVFYVADARGYVLPSDEARPERLAERQRQGVDWYVEPGSKPTGRELERWLDSHAQLVHASEHGRLWRLAQEGSSE